MQQCFKILVVSIRTHGSDVNVYIFVETTDDVARKFENLLRRTIRVFVIYTVFEKRRWIKAWLVVLCTVSRLCLTYLRVRLIERWSRVYPNCQGKRNSLANLHSKSEIFNEHYSQCYFNKWIYTFKPWKTSSVVVWNCTIYLNPCSNGHNR